MTLSLTSIGKLMAKIKAEKHLEIVPGATHLFEEPGTLQEVARLAADWFKRYLGGQRAQETAETKRLQRTLRPLHRDKS